VEDLCNPRGQKEREAAGAGAPAPPPRLTPPGEGGRKPPPRWRITPLYAKREPRCRARGRQVGRLLVSVGSRVHCIFTWGLGFRHGCAPRPRAHQSRPPRSRRSSFAVESIGGAGFLVTVGPGAHGTCRRRLGGRPGGAFPTYPLQRRFPSAEGPLSRATPRRARLQYHAVQKRAPGGARCAHSGCNVDAVRGKL
jgi:hypothetical protein